MNPSGYPEHTIGQPLYQQQPQATDPAIMNRAMMQYDDEKKSKGMMWVL